MTITDKPNITTTSNDHAIVTPELEKKTFFKKHEQFCHHDWALTHKKVLSNNLHYCAEPNIRTPFSHKHWFTSYEYTCLPHGVVHEWWTSIADWFPCYYWSWLGMTRGTTIYGHSHLLPHLKRCHGDCGHCLQAITIWPAKCDMERPRASTHWIPLDPIGIWQSVFLCLLIYCDLSK